jgi:3-dehydroquinate synthase
MEGDAAGAGAERVRVELGARGYDIHIGSGLITRAGALLRRVLPMGRVVVVTDETVAALHLPALALSLAEAGIRYDAVVVPAGEESKALAPLGDLLDRLLALPVERKVAVLALGGGVVGDLAGFAAAITLRGLPLVQVPTTLLAQVDSAVGGKTGITSRHGKNLIGAFHQPLAVLADVASLATLPPRELRAGYAEVVKMGVIDRPDFFAWAEENGGRLIAGDEAARAEAVRRSCLAKAAIVGEDEREEGRRALLNLGHTFGHALEAEAGFGEELRHGEAVAIGMVLALRLSVRLGLCPPADAERLARHLAAVGLPTRSPAPSAGRWTPNALIAHMTRDKKVADGRITFVLARGIGRAFLARDIPRADVEAVLAGGGAS